MIVKEPAITGQILKIADQYNNNISTRFLRPLYTSILSEGELSREVAALTEQTDAIVSQGIHLDELYQHILGMARFIYLVRTNVIPNARNLSGSSANDANRIYRDMAVNNFGANLSVLSDLVNELYMLTVEYDRRKNSKGQLVFSAIPGLSDIGRYLVTR
jgi:hypothetical protein